MKFTSIKQTLIDFTVFLTILAFGSCSVADDTAPPNNPPGPQPYMSFTLTNRSGTTVATITELSRGSTYGLVITPTNGTTIPTADYTITYTPATAITTNAASTNSVDFTVNNITDRTVTFSVVHRTNSAVSNTLTLNLPNQVTTSFQQDIENAVTMPYMATANALTREVLEPLRVNAGATLVKRYVTTNGGATIQDGTSWATAWAATNLRNAINSITDATANKVYLVMIAGGSYTPGAARGDSFSMKDRVAIMGGFQTTGGWGRAGTTIFSGDIGTVGTTTDNSYHVFNNSGTLNNAHLYGVTITNGNANGTFPQNAGGGMYNFSSSPVLTEVVFSGNTAAAAGGGLYNTGSSPVLTRVVFSGNTATRTGSGGGMFNSVSSPVLTRVVFSRNTATSDAGGMYNFASSPVLTRVVFSRNTATGNGGGMYNSSSSPVIIGAVFTNNRGANGGGMLNDNGGAPGPLIVNTIFSANTLSGTGSGTNIAMHLNGGGAENIRIAGSVLGIGLAQPTNAIVGYNGSDALNISYHSLTNGAVNFGADATTGGLTYPTITGGSAVNLGLFVRRSGTTYYFSEDTTTWYTGFSATGGWGSTGTPPATAIDLTATDIAGNARNARPDAGVYEVQ